MTNAVIWSDFPFENAMSPDHATGMFSRRFLFHSAVIYCIFDSVKPFAPSCHSLCLFLPYSGPIYLLTVDVEELLEHLTTLKNTHSVGLLWTRDRPLAETSTWEHTILTCDKHPCPHRDSNPQSEQTKGRRPKPLAAWPPLIAFSQNCIVVAYRVSEQKGVR